MELLHKVRFVHTDIKPENILLRQRQMRGQEYNLEMDYLVKIIDVGTAIPFEDLKGSVIQTREYRAPEVILGLPYSEVNILT